MMNTQTTPPALPQQDPIVIIPPEITASNTNQTKRPKKKIWLILAIIFGVLISCATLTLVLTKISTSKIESEKAPLESVVDQFMKFMKQKDVESAYDLISSRAKRQIEITELSNMLKGNNYVLYDGYLSVNISNIRITKAINTDPDVPQGTVATISGVIEYKDGFQGRLEGVFEKENDIWRIDGINITVPPDKVNKK